MTRPLTRPAVPGRSAVPLLALTLAACATVPGGPSLQALRGSQRTSEQFVADDARCRALVNERMAATGAPAANQNVAASAAAGTAIGAVTGAVFDGSSGAAAGAVVGLALGALAGSTSPATYASSQQQYDTAYYACMYTLGHKVPVPAHEAARYRAWFESVMPTAASVPPAPAAPGAPAAQP
jgi:hypothetical protein